MNGYLDGLPVSKVRAFEDGLLAKFRDKHMDLLDAIRTEKQISDVNMPKLKAAVDAYAKSFA